MKKKVFGRRFKKDVNQRKALFKNLMRSLVLNEEIKTTEAKAKSIKGEVEKLITMAKKGKPSEYHLKKRINEDAVRKLVDDLGPRFLKRPGGYTRIVRLKNRLKDNAEMVLLEFVEKGVAQRVLPGGQEVKSGKKTVKKSKAKEKKIIKKGEKVSAKVTKSIEKVKAVAPKRTVTRQRTGER